METLFLAYMYYFGNNRCIGILIKASNENNCDSGLPFSSVDQTFHKPDIVTCSYL